MDTKRLPLVFVTTQKLNIYFAIYALPSTLSSTASPDNALSIGSQLCFSLYPRLVFFNESVLHLFLMMRWQGDGIVQNLNRSETTFAFSIGDHYNVSFISY